MNIESRRCSNEINQIDYIFSYLISQYTINSNLEKQIIITQPITIENSIDPYKIIVNKFSKPLLTGYALLEAFHPDSGMITRFYLNSSGDLYATDVGVTKTGEWWINGAYIAK